MLRFFLEMFAPPWAVILPACVTSSAASLPDVPQAAPNVSARPARRATRAPKHDWRCC